MSPISQAKGSLNDSLSKSLSHKYIEKIENIIPFSAKTRVCATFMQNEIWRKAF